METLYRTTTTRVVCKQLDCKISNCGVDIELCAVLNQYHIKKKERRERRNQLGRYTLTFQVDICITGALQAPIRLITVIKAQVVFHQSVMERATKIVCVTKTTALKFLYVFFFFFFKIDVMLLVSFLFGENLV